MSQPQNKSTLRLALKPRYWPAAAGFLILRLLILLPITLQFAIGKWGGHAFYLLAKRRRHIAEVNINLCFPKLNQKQKQRIVRESFESAGISVFETALSWWAGDARLQSRVTIKGIEHIISAIEQGKGVLLLSAHMTCLEIGCRFLTMRVPTYNMYKRQRNALINKVITDGRKKHAKGIIERRDVRGFIRALKQGNVCWYAPDQDFGRQNSVFAPFMGVATSTLTATSRLATVGDAVVIPYFPKRRRNEIAYDITVLPPLENFPSGDDVRDATLINELIAEQIILAPEQYLWGHRRFKTRPEGEADVYGKKGAKKTPA
ncbi:MAG: LpxL/LpxP family Kdo(2)-lipid IV(A) lauroyl/palmitoleoyl acyltransferase [Gammaproteobacteria bacterium]|nr:LpxL/LpxP family Kdo(2)-lipid IV(A) lauroyl/palmitoleoyl acyltransferase [Gammaproteobacteria bacterium]